MLPNASRKRTRCSISGISTRQLDTRCPSKVGGVSRSVWMLYSAGGVRVARHVTDGDG